MVPLRLITRFAGVALLLAALQSGHAAPPDAAAPLATVGSQTITAGSFVQQVQQGVRQRFYHGKIPEGELEKYGDEVLQQMIDRLLLLQEAKRRKMQPDHKAIEAEIAGYEQQYAASERWQKERAQRLPLLRANLEQQSLLNVFEEQVRKLPPPTDKEVRAYYAKHPEKFTTPEKLRVSLILLKVEPSSPEAAWQGAMEEGKSLLEKLRKGGDFAALAKLHSGDGSAEKGGDLGYIHQGMLTPEAQQALDKVKVGELTEPLRMLQGVALFRVDERVAAQLNPYEKVRARAGELLARDKGDLAWRSLTERLRKQSTISIDRQLFKSLFAAAPEGAHAERR